MKRAEIIIIIIALIGFVLKYFKIVGATTLLILSLNTLAVFYFYLSYAFFNGLSIRESLRKSSYVNISRGKLGTAILSGIVLATSIVSILFKTLNYPGSYMIYISLLLSIALFVYLLYKHTKDSGIFYYTILKRVGAVSVIILLMVGNITI